MVFPIAERAIRLWFRGMYTPVWRCSCRGTGEANGFPDFYFFVSFIFEEVGGSRGAYRLVCEVVF